MRLARRAAVGSKPQLLIERGRRVAGKGHVNCQKMAEVICEHGDAGAGQIVPAKSHLPSDNFRYQSCTNGSSHFRSASAREWQGMELSILSCEANRPSTCRFRTSVPLSHRDTILSAGRTATPSLAERHPCKRRERAESSHTGISQPVAATKVNGLEARHMHWG